MVSSAIWNKFGPVGFRQVQIELFEITRVQIYSKLHKKIILIDFLLILYMKK